MHHKVYETRLPVPVERLWEFHSSADALQILTPPNRRIRLISDDLAVREGALHEMRMSIGPIPVLWRARLHDVTPPHGFTDTAERGPFMYWSHRHDFLPDGDGAILRDTVHYIPPFGPFGVVVNALFLSRDLDRLFAFRHAATAAALAALPVP